MNTVTLIRPLFQKKETFLLGLSKRHLALGPLALLLDRDYTRAMFHLLLSIVTMGIYWVYFAIHYNQIKVKNMLNSGYLPAGKSDEFILIDYGIDIQDGKSDYLPISRLGGGNHLIGPTAAQYRSREPLN